MPNTRKPPVPVSGIVYGEIIYWGTCFSALLVLLGTIKSFMETNSAVSVNYLLDAVLSGKSVDTIWMSSKLHQVPNTSLYLSTWASGESLTVIGIAVGVLSVIPAIFFSSVYLWRSNNHIFAIVALVSGLITLIAPSGLIAP
jgi:hypothetical protein